jgi:hypothetical protein
MTQQHVSEEQLILHYYGETSDSGPDPGIDTHLTVCPGCREEYTRLQHVLNVVEIPVPERGADYEDQVWNRLAPKLGAGRRSTWWAPRKWAAQIAMAGGICTLVVSAFMAGRYSPSSNADKAAVQPAVRERVLVVAVGDHLQRSEMVLVELKNQPDGKQIDISDEQVFAKDLLSANRLYRQTALSTGESGLVRLLEDLERVLVEVVHSPSRISADDLEMLRERIESQSLLFKMRIVGSNLSAEASREL